MGTPTKKAAKAAKKPAKKAAKKPAKAAGAAAAAPNEFFEAAAATESVLAWGLGEPAMLGVQLHGASSLTLINISAMAANDAPNKVRIRVGVPGQAGPKNIDHFESALAAGPKAITIAMENASQTSKTFDLVFSFGGTDVQEFTYTLAPNERRLVIIPVV